jgi:hypothetical protein
MSLMRSAWRLSGLALALLAGCLAGLRPLPAAADLKGRLGGQYRYWNMSDGNDLRDILGYFAARSWHVQLEYWDFVSHDTDDQFRPEVGLHLHDKRNSVYSVIYRHEHTQERVWFGTDQVLTSHLVGRVLGSPIISHDHGTLWVVSGGADYYWKSWNFASFDVIRDPRQAGLWVYPMRVRLANEANDWVQVTLAPASQQTLGWAIDVKKRWVRLGYERNNRYDFTQVNNDIFTVGFEVEIPPPPK